MKKTFLHLSFSTLPILLLLLWARPMAASSGFMGLDTGGHTALIRYLIFTRDGRRLVSAGDDKSVRVWDVAADRTDRIIRGGPPSGAEGKIYAAALSPNEAYLAVGGWMGPSEGYGLTQLGRIRLHDFHSGRVIGLLEGHRDVTLSLAFSPDSRTLASGGLDRTVRLWDIPARMSSTPRPRPSAVLEGHEAHVYALAFSPDGRLLASGGDDGQLALWRVPDGRLIRRIQAHNGRLRALAWSPDGAFVVTGASDRTIKVWRGQGGEYVRQLTRLDKNPRSLSFSPDGRTVLVGTASYEGPWRCHFLSFSSGKRLAGFDLHHGTVLATAFSRDGRLAALGGGRNHEIFLVSPENGRLVKRLVGAGRP